MTERQRQLLIELCDPIVLIGWCHFDPKDRGRNIVAGKLNRLGLAKRRRGSDGWEYRISESGTAALQWEIDTANDIKRIAAIVGQE